MAETPNVLANIARYKAEEVAALKARTSIEALREQAKALTAPRGFHAVLRKPGPSLIAEIKKASPSKGIIREDFDPVSIARSYERGGASCLSVLTDGPGFQGSEQIFRDVRKVTSLPMLRKDFMLEPIQIAESAAMGADAILVILAMIDDKTARTLMDEAENLGLDALVETHDESEIDRAVSLGATLIGINNRDLRSFHTTLDTFEPLARRVPTGVTLIAESGIFTSDDILRLTQDGADGFLVGESLMRQDDVEGAVQGLLGNCA